MIGTTPTRQAAKKCRTTLAEMPNSWGVGGAAQEKKYTRRAWSISLCQKEIDQRKTAVMGVCHRNTGANK